MLTTRCQYHMSNFTVHSLKFRFVTDGLGISCKIALRWMPLDLTDDKSTLWPYGVARPQWVKKELINFVNVCYYIIQYLLSVVSSAAVGSKTNTGWRKNKAWIMLLMTVIKINYLHSREGCWNHIFRFYHDLCLGETCPLRCFYMLWR